MHENRDAAPRLPASAPGCRQTAQQTLADDTRSRNASQAALYVEKDGIKIVTKGGKTDVVPHERILASWVDVSARYISILACNPPWRLLLRPAASIRKPDAPHASSCRV